MVIQRLQTLFLLIAAILAGLFTFLTLAQINTEEFSYIFSTLGFSIEGITTQPTPNEGHVGFTCYLFALSLLGVVLPLINIFLFKNLRLQKKICLISIVIEIASFCTALGIGYNTFSNSEVLWNYSVLICPLASALALVLAYRYISSDQRKLQSADRIR